MTLKLVVPSVLALLLTAACGGAAPPPMAAAPSVEAAPPPPPPTPVAAAPSSAATGAPAKAKSDLKTRAPSIIFQGEMKMLADEDALAKTIDRIIDIAESEGGHVSARKDASVQIKVPSARFRETMKEIDALGGVTSQSINAQDVSEEMHDLDVRLANLRATRARLQELMNKAGAIPDVLSVEKELERVAQEIDTIEGRLEFLKARTSLSSIDVALTAKPKPVQPVVATTSAPPAKRIPDLPIPWVKDVGIDPLLALKK